MTQQYPIEILHHDDDLIIVNKPPGILTLPDRFGKDKNNLLHFLTEHFGHKIYVVHRIDRETSGIICFAKNDVAHRSLSMAFEDKSVDKIYLALVDGVMHHDEGEIDKPIGEHQSIPGKMAIVGSGKPSLTLFRVKEKFKNFTLVDAKIMTGRMHQIRVHFTSNGFPLAIDAVYGRRSELFLNQIKQKKLKIGKFAEERALMTRTTLHAQTLRLDHPTTGERLEFVAPLHKDFAAVISQLQKWGK